MGASINFMFYGEVISVVAVLTLIGMEEKGDRLWRHLEISN